MKAIRLEKVTYVAIHTVEYEKQLYLLQKFKHQSSIKVLLKILYESDIGYSYQFGWHYFFLPYHEGIPITEVSKQVGFSAGLKMATTLLFELLPYEKEYQKLFLFADQDHIVYDSDFHLLQGISLFRLQERIDQVQAMNACIELVMPFIELHLTPQRRKLKAVQVLYDKVDRMSYSSIREMIKDLEAVGLQDQERRMHKKTKLSIKIKIKLLLLALLTLLVFAMVIIHVIYHQFDAIQALFPL